MIDKWLTGLFLVLISIGLMVVFPKFALLIIPALIGGAIISLFDETGSALSVVVVGVVLFGIVASLSPESTKIVGSLLLFCLLSYALFVPFNNR